MLVAIPVSLSTGIAKAMQCVAQDVQNCHRETLRRQMQGSAKTPKRKAFTRLKGFSVGSQEIFGLYAWLYTK